MTLFFVQVEIPVKHSQAGCRKGNWWRSNQEEGTSHGNQKSGAYDKYEQVCHIYLVLIKLLQICRISYNIF